MKIRVLGCSASELPDANLSSFLVDGKILLDAGTIGEVLNEAEQWKIRHVLLTHAHLDHVKDLPFFADNISISNRKHYIAVISVPAVNRALRKNLLNDVLWPDFTKIPSPDSPIIKLENIRTGRPFSLDGFKVTAYPVNHTVTAVGYHLKDSRGRTLFYSGDTGPDDSRWKSITDMINGLIIEVSLPDRYASYAMETGHLTPRLLDGELKKMKVLPERIFITHCKPRYRDRISEEVSRLKYKNIRMLRDGDGIEI